MSLSNKKIMVSAESVVGTTKVATFSGTIGTDGSKEVTITSRYLDKALYDSNKSTIESDRDGFVTYVRNIQAGLN